MRFSRMKKVSLLAGVFLTAACVSATAAVVAAHRGSVRWRDPFVSGSKPTKGSFLIARRGLPDPNFAETVVLVVGNDEQGSMGLVVNRPTPMKLSHVLKQFEELRDRDDRLYAGGPVSRLSVFVLLRGGEEPAGAMEVFDSVYLTANTDTLQAELRKKRPAASLRVYGGYAGWGSGQLDRELERGDWHVMPADAAVIFDRDAREVWSDLVRHFEGQWAVGPSMPFPTEEELRCPTSFRG